MKRKKEEAEKREAEEKRRREEVEREKVIEVNTTVGLVFDSPQVGPFLIMKRPVGEGVSVNALTVLTVFSFVTSGRITNCFVLSSNTVEAVSASECVPGSRMIVEAEELEVVCVNAVCISIQGTSSHPQLSISTPACFPFVTPAT